MNKTLWIVSGGIESIPGIIKAKQMGLKVIVSDGNSHAPGFAYADDHFVASTYDISATLKQIRNYHRKNNEIDGIISVGADVPLTVASIAESLDLQSIPVETAKICSDKLVMKELLFKKKVPIPWFKHIQTVNELKSILKDRDAQLIIKPVDSRGSRGVLKLKKKIDLNWALKYSKKYSPSSRVIVEEFEEGPQFSTESLCFKNKIFTPGFCDRNYPFLEKFSPYIIEDGGEQPSVASKLVKKKTIDVVELATKALDVKTGTIKGDLVSTSQGSKVIEMAPRLSGGWFSTDQIPLSTGIDFLGIAFKIALREKIFQQEAIPKFRKAVAIRYFFPNPGVVKSIKNQELLQNKKWIHKLMIFVKEKDKIDYYTDHTKRTGFVITTGKTRKEAVSRAEHVVNTIEIQTRKKSN